MTPQRLLAVAVSRPALILIGPALMAVIGITAGYAPDVAMGVMMAPLLTAAIVACVALAVRRRPDAFVLQPFLLGVGMRFAMVAMHLFIGFIVYNRAVDFIGWWALTDNVWDILTTPAKLGYFLTADSWFDDNFQSRLQLATPSMILLMMGFVGPNIVAIFVVCGALSVVAAYWYYRAFESVAPDAASRRRYVWLIFVFPSFAFWSVLLGKDVWIIFFMAFATLCFSRAIEHVRALPVLGFCFALVMITLLRAHISAVLALAAVCAIVVRPLPVSGPTLFLLPLMRVGIIAAAAGLFAQVGRLMLSSVGVAALTLEALGERAHMAHQGFVTEGGGAALPVALASGSPTDLLKFLPIGIGTLLFRPFPWEAHNAMALATSVENVAFIALVVWRIRSLWYAVRAARTQPLFVFAFVSALAGAAVLCVEWNLGAMVRHRAMILPFLFMLLSLPRTKGKPAT